MSVELTPEKARDLENGVNQGVIAPTEEEQEIHAETVGLDISQFPIIAPDSNIDKFLSDFDRQAINGFETFGCNIFSSIGGLEILINALGGDSDLSIDGKTELSERKACVDCGLTGNGGSSEAQWEQGINSHGFVRNDLYPFVPGMTQSQFFAPEPADIEALGLKVFERWEKPFHRQIATDLASIKEGLKRGGIKIFIGTGAGWNQGEPNVIQDTSVGMNHAVLVRYIDGLGIHIRDQYPPFLKVLAPDYKVYFAFQTLSISKGQTMSDSVFVHKAGTQEYGFYLPTISQDALKDKALNLGLNILKADGSIDFSKARDISGL